MEDVFVTEEDFDTAWEQIMSYFIRQNKIMEAMAFRIAELEKNAHKPVTFVADENGFLKIAKESE